MLWIYLPGNPLRTTNTLYPSAMSTSGGERGLDKEAEEEEFVKDRAEEEEDARWFDCLCGESGRVEWSMNAIVNTQFPCRIT